MENLVQIINSPSYLLGLYCLILYMALKIYFKRRAHKIVQKKLPEKEYIICDITPCIMLDYLYSFAYGHNIYEICNAIFDETISCATSIFIWKWAFVFAGAILLIMLSSARTFLTNKRIITEYGSLPISKNTKLKTRHYFYKNIKNYCETKTLIGAKFVITFHNQICPFVIYNMFTFCYKPAVKIIEGIYSDINEIGYQINYEKTELVRNI